MRDITIKPQQVHQTETTADSTNQLPPPVAQIDKTQKRVAQVIDNTATTKKGKQRENIYISSNQTEIIPQTERYKAFFKDIIKSYQKYQFRSESRAKRFVKRYQEYDERVTNEKKYIQDQGVIMYYAIAGEKGIYRNNEEKKICQKQILGMIENVLLESIELRYPNKEFTQNMTVIEARGIAEEAIENYSSTVKEEYVAQIHTAVTITEIRNVFNKAFKKNKEEISFQEWNKFWDIEEENCDISGQMNAEYDTALSLIQEIIEKYAKDLEVSKLQIMIQDIINNLMVTNTISVYDDWKENLITVLVNNFGMEEVGVNNLIKEIQNGKSPKTLEEKIVFAMMQKGKMLTAKQNIFLLGKKHKSVIEKYNSLEHDKKRFYQWDQNLIRIYKEIMEKITHIYKTE